MTDINPGQAVAVGGFGASGQTGAFDLTGSDGVPEAVFLASVVTGVAGSSPSLQIFLDAMIGGNWTQVGQLTAQSASGVQSAIVAVPIPASLMRIRWTVSGTGAEFTGKCFAGVA